MLQPHVAVGQRVDAGDGLRAQRLRPLVLRLDLQDRGGGGGGGDPVGTVGGVAGELQQSVDLLAAFGAPRLADRHRESGERSW